MEHIEGEPLDFKVTLLRKPRYIREDRCTACTNCVQYCPVEIKDPFNRKMSKTKAVHIHFAQAIPLIAYIDEENCLYLKEKKCGICETVCKNDAIDFNQTPKRVELRVGAIIFSAGFEPYDPSWRSEYGYERFENVITSMDFERLLSSTGPYQGEVRRPSDLKHPKKIAWIQCVGSRHVLPGAHSYCSAVCCTYTQKQVILAKTHDPHVECVVFHNDIRAYGKDFERFFQRASSLPGVRFIRSYVSIAGEDPVTKNVRIRYASFEEGVKEEEFELVVLSVGLTPPSSLKDLASKFSIELNPHGFVKTLPFSLLETNRPGIFVSGTVVGPMDIPESVYTGSGAASKCGELLKRRRHKLTVPKVYPEERDVRSEEPRIGVFVCHCGANIGRVVNVPSVVDYALSLPYVVYAQEQLFSCSTEGTKQIMEAIKEKGLNRVIVAACTPKTHEPTFRTSLREAGLNQYLLDMANIREHCSWVHSMEREEATEKAKDLLKISLARALKLEAFQDLELPVDKRVLVVGGGVAGMTCALSLANQGHEVYLVEKEGELGGMARKIHFTLEGLDVQAYLRELIRKVYEHPLIHVLTRAEISEVTGYVGNFLTKVESEGRELTIKHGAVVIATGAVEYRPKEYYYGQDERVMTNLELEERIAKRDERVMAASSIVMIQCVGSRNKERNYCSRICCSHSVKNALKLKELNPEVDIYVLFRDMRTYGFMEDYYREAQKRGVFFVRYEVDEDIVMEPTEEALKISVKDPVLNKVLQIDADLLVLATGVVAPEENLRIAQLFKVSLAEDNFFKEAHVKLRPVDLFGPEGIYLCGMAHYPKHIHEAVAQANAASIRVLTLLAHDTVTVSGSVCVIEEDKCMGCGACVEVCTYGALKLEETKRGKKATINPPLCKGCGLCNTQCPTGAIQLKHLKDEQILAQIEAASPEERIEELLKAAEAR